MTFTTIPSAAAATAAVTDAGDGTYFVVLTAASEGRSTLRTPSFIFHFPTITNSREDMSAERA